MAIKIECNKVYKCQSPLISTASIHVVSGSATIKGSNVTETDPTTGKLIVPRLADLIDMGDDTVTAGTISFITGLPEWFAFVGNAEIWIKMGVDPRIEPGD